MEWSAAVREYFTQVAIERGAQSPIGEFIALLASGQAAPGLYSEVVERHGLLREHWFRNDRLDLVLGYVRAALEAGPLDRERQRDVTHLKEWLEIAEGEFATHRPVEVATLLQGQLEVILDDREISEAEDLYQVELQRAFDLGYDQYLAFTRTVLERVRSDLSMVNADALAGPARARLRRQRAALEPLYCLAVAQPRTLGALY